MYDEKYSRGLDMFDPSKVANIKVGIVGAGGIGSNTAYCLAKMGFSNIKICDFDEVELHNCSSQFYSTSQLGQVKVEALAKNIEYLTDVKMETINGVYDPKDFEDCQIMIMAVDNMATRKEIALGSTKARLIIDGRMVKRLFQLYPFSPLMVDEYLENNRVSDEEIDKQEAAGAAPTKCTEKAIAYNGLGIASFIGSLCSDFVNGNPLKESYRMDFHNMMIG